MLPDTQAEVCQETAVSHIQELPDRVVVETKDGRSFFGRYLIGADGDASVVVRSVGLRRSKLLVAAIEAEISVLKDVMCRFADAPLFIFGEMRMGYLWVFPMTA
ncbi:MAG: NAD(P)/FAD-dependent oxidoreductase [Anaerolineae bacterium]